MMSAGFWAPVRLKGTSAPCRRSQLPGHLPENMVGPDIVPFEGFEQLRSGESPSCSWEISASS
jgi:hypothetical protein